MSRRSDRTISVLVPPDLMALTSEDPRTVGPYVLIGRIGVGHTGVVYGAVDPRTAESTLLVVKTLRPEHFADPIARQRLEERLRALSTIGSRCDVPPLEFDAEAASPWLAMPYVAGTPLAQFVRKRGPLYEGMLLALAAGLAQGLATLHRADVAHGDLKPSNIVLSASGPRILDCALPVDPSVARHSGAWLSPERHRGEAPSFASDVFGWGAVVAFAATGRLPFGYGEPEQMAARVAEEEPDLTGVPADLLPLVRRALDKNPGNRPTVREIIGATLAVWEASTPPAASPGAGVLTHLLEREWQGIVDPPGTPRAIRVTSRSRGNGIRIPLVAAGVVVALALVGGGAWVAFDALGGDGGDEEDASPASAAEEPSPSPSPSPTGPETATVRFGALPQPNPADGPWVFTEVEFDENAADAAVPEGSALSPAEWSTQWSDVSSEEEPLEAMIAPDAEVYCAQFCLAPGEVSVDEQGRGTWEVTGQDFINYLGWGDVVIAEVTFAEEESTEGTPEIVRITELFQPAP